MTRRRVKTAASVLGAGYCLSLVVLAALQIFVLLLPEPRQYFEAEWYVQAGFAASGTLLAVMVLGDDTPLLQRAGGALLMGSAVPLLAAAYVGVPPAQDALPIVATALIMSPIISGALKPLRCPDSGLIGYPWRFERCFSELDCPGKLCHKSTLIDGSCTACHEELEVRSTLQLVRIPSSSTKKCDRTKELSSPDDPVEVCFCGEHAYKRSIYRGGYCPDAACKYSQAKAKERLARRSGA